MSLEIDSPFLELLKDRIDLAHIPFSERGSRLLVMKRDDELIIRLAERWFKADPRLSAYRERPPILEHLRFTDGQGNLLPFQLTSYPHRLDFATQAGTFSLTFVDSETLLIAMPPGPCGIRFLAHVNDGQTDRRGGILRVVGDVRRSIAYTTNRPIVENSMTQVAIGDVEVCLRVEGDSPGGFLFNLTPRLGFNRYIPRLDEAFLTAARRWHDWFSAAPEVEGPFRTQYYYAWWVMRAGLISTRYYTTREAMTPSKIHYVGIWQWDAYFHALAYRHVDSRLARDQIRVVLDHQRADGMIPDAVHDEGTVTHLTFPIEADVTKPPLLAWSAWKLYETDGDREFLDEIYEPIVHWNDWWFQTCDVDHNGLCEYHHPYSSGADDSPLWDGGMPVTSPELNTYLYTQMENLSRIAGVLGMPEEARRWQEKADRLLERMQKLLWDRKTRLFLPRRDGAFIPIRTPFSLMPLLTGRLDPKIARPLINHLFDPATFWTRYPVPTVAYNEAAYSSMEMWRGPTWININFLLIEGLERSGYHTEANQLRLRTLEMITNYPDIYEYYNPETGVPCDRAATTFGWSAALFIELALQAAERHLVPVHTGV